MKIYYCGAYWCPLWVKKLLSVYFNEACSIHDTGYRNKTMSRKATDIKFLCDMLQQNDHVFLAIVFYVFVRLLGWISWKH